MFFWPYLTLLALSALLLSAAMSVGIFAWLSSRQALLDIPSERSNHTLPIPRGGGVAVIFAMACFLLVAGVSSLLLWALLGISIISFADDLRGVPIRYRLAVHLGAALLCLIALNGLVFQGILPPYADHLIAALLLVVYLNLYNFMDGIDGITCTHTICLCFGLIAVSVSTNGILSGFTADGAIIAAACLPFLYYNWHPARMFLGDVGSIGLGLATGFMLLHLADTGYPEAALVLPAYYLVDAGYTLLKRLLSRKKIWEAHSEHAYQQAVRNHNPHDQVVLWILAGNLILIALAVLATREDFGLVAVALAYALAAALRWKLTVLKPAPVVLMPVTIL
jgi:UDP-N-acetylmuramyl pentapeptide phosphotransferase/UDP-N-acetylglucosamine-1-phosphate transferase